MVAGIVTSTR